MKTPSDSEAQLAPFNVLRNFITIATKATKNGVTNLAKQPSENAEQNAGEENDYDEDNTVLDFSSGTAQESEVTEIEKYSVKTPTHSEAQLAPFNVLRNFITNSAKQPDKFEKYSVKTQTDSETHVLRNFVTNAAKVTKLVITNLAKLAKQPEENAVEEDDDNTVLDFSSGTAQETESTGGCLFQERVQF